MCLLISIKVSIEIQNSGNKVIGTLITFFKFCINNFDSNTMVIHYIIGNFIINTINKHALDFS